MDLTHSDVLMQSLTRPPAQNSPPPYPGARARLAPLTGNSAPPKLRSDPYNRCGYCGRFVAWVWWSDHHFFAAHERVWCSRTGCVDRAELNQASPAARRAWPRGGA